MYAWSVNLINSDGAPGRRDNLSPYTGDAVRKISRLLCAGGSISAV
jgi:hypothetical protein